MSYQGSPEYKDWEGWHVLLSKQLEWQMHFHFGLLGMGRGGMRFMLLQKFHLVDEPTSTLKEHKGPVSDRHSCLLVES